MTSMNAGDTLLATYSPPRHHAGPVSAVAVDGGAVFSGAYDGCLGSWAKDGDVLTPRWMLYLHEKGVNCVAASPAAPIVATGGSDGVACIVTPGPRHANVTRCSHPGDVECAVFDATGQRLFSGGTDGYGRIFDIGTGIEHRAIRHGATVGAAVRHRDPELLVTACNDRRVRLLRWSNGEIVAVSEPHAGPVKALAVCAEGILAAGHDRRVFLYDFELRTRRELMRFSTTPKAMAAEPDGAAVWMGVYDQRLLRYACADGGLRPDGDVHSSRFWAHGVAAGAGFAVIGAFDGAPLLCTNDAGEWRTGPAADTAVACISTAVVDGPTVIVGGDSGALRVGSARDAEISGAMISMDGAITSIAGTKSDLVAGTWDGIVAKLSDGEERWTATWPSSLGRGRRAPSPVLRVAADAARVIAGLYTDGWACFDARDGQPLWHAIEATGAVKSVDLRGDVYAVTGRYDPLRVGDASTGVVRARLALETPVSDVVAISPFEAETTRIAVCAGSHEVWFVTLDRRGGEWTLEVLHRSTGHALPVKALLWIAPDEVLAGDYEGRVVEHRLGRASGPARVAECRLGISSLTRMPDGGVLFSTFDGGIGRLASLRVDGSSTARS